MARKLIRVSRRMLFIWFMLAGLILLLAPENLTGKFQFAFARIFQWPLSISRNISLSARMSQPVTDAVSRRKYQQLQNHLASVIEQWNQERKKVEKLSGLHNRAIWEGAKFVLADVITASIDSSHGELIINRGENDGLAKGQFVLGYNNIIGTISNVDPRTAQVKLVTDPMSKIAVKIADAGGIMKGNGKNSTKLQLPIKHKVKLGDNVIAAKKPGYLDGPMIIGKVTQCRRDDDNPLLWDITVEPTCDIEMLNNVVVIIMNP